MSEVEDLEIDVYFQGKFHEEIIRIMCELGSREEPGSCSRSFYFVEESVFQDEMVGCVTTLHGTTMVKSKKLPS